MKLTSKLAVLLWLLLISCGFPVASHCTEKSVASKKAVTAETLWLLSYFAKDDFPLVGDAVVNRLPAISLSLRNSDSYFLSSSSGIHPLTVGEHSITAYDLSLLADDLSSYSARAFKKTNFDDSNKSLVAASDLIALPLSLVPPRLITSGYDPETKVLGIYSYSYATMPISQGVRAIQNSLEVIDPSPSGSFSEAKKRTLVIRAELRIIAKKATPFFSHKEWGIGIEETADTRAYAKLFEEELPILRQQLTLLKSDIDKGFAELQKQQDAKAQADKATTTDKAATTK